MPTFTEVQAQMVVNLPEGQAKNAIVPFELGSTTPRSATATPFSLQPGDPSTQLPSLQPRGITPGVNLPSGDATSAVVPFTRPGTPTATVAAPSPVQPLASAGEPTYTAPRGSSLPAGNGRTPGVAPIYPPTPRSFPSGALAGAGIAAAGAALALAGGAPVGGTVGGTIGQLAGGLLGAAIGGVPGAFVGSLLGGLAGAYVGDMIFPPASNGSLQPANPRQKIPVHGLSIGIAPDGVYRIDVKYTVYDTASGQPQNQASNSPQAEGRNLSEAIAAVVAQHSGSNQYTTDKVDSVTVVKISSGSLPEQPMADPLGVENTIPEVDSAKPPVFFKPGVPPKPDGKLAPTKNPNIPTPILPIPGIPAGNPKSPPAQPLTPTTPSQPGIKPDRNPIPGTPEIPSPIPISPLSPSSLPVLVPTLQPTTGTTTGSGKNPTTKNPIVTPVPTLQPSTTPTTTTIPGMPPGGCCPEHGEALEELQEKLGSKLFPVTLPLLTGDETIVIENLPELVLYNSRNIDAVVGLFPMEISALQPDGNKRSMKLENISHALQEMFAMSLTMAEDCDAAVNIGARIATEVINTKVKTSQGNELIQAIIKYIGMAVAPTPKEIRLNFTPTAMGADSKLQNTEMVDFLKPSKKNYVGSECAEKDQLMPIVNRILQNTEISRASVWHPIKPAGTKGDNFIGTATKRANKKATAAEDKLWQKLLEDLKKQGYTFDETGNQGKSRL